MIAKFFSAITSFFVSTFSKFAGVAKFGKFRKPAAKAPVVISAYHPDSPEAILDRMRLHAGDDPEEAAAQSEKKDIEHAARSVC